MFKKIKQFFKTASRRKAAVLVAAALAAVAVPAAMNAWGPSRGSDFGSNLPTFTWDKPATYNVFNSITNNQEYGDERNFVTACEVSPTNPSNSKCNEDVVNWSNDLTIADGKEYFVRMYVHNNKATNYNDNSAPAQNVRARVTPWFGEEAAKSFILSGIIESSNSSPTKVWDEVKFSSNQDFTLKYVPGSALYTNRYNGVSHFNLPDSLISGNGNGTGALLGYEQMNGLLPGCSEFIGWVTFKVKAEVLSADFSIAKQARAQGETLWRDTVANVRPGQTVEYQLVYTNTGETEQKNVILKDELPNNMTYVSGSTRVRGAVGVDGITTAAGLNIGTVAKGASAVVTFEARVAANDDLAVCGVNTLVNIVKARPTDAGNGFNLNEKSDTATVTVTKDCVEPKVPCEYDPSLFADDPNCVPPVTPCEYDPSLAADDPNCVEPVEPCEYNPELAADDPDCKEIEEPTPCEFDPELTADDPNCKAPEEPKQPEKPATRPPVDLPVTGAPEGLVSGIIGIGAITASASAYITSRKKD